MLLCLHRNIFLILGSFFFFVHFSRIYLFLVDWWAVSNGKVNNELLANCFGRNLERETDLWIFCFFLKVTSDCEACGCWLSCSHLIA